jgi:hypothetical protein
VNHLQIAENAMNEVSTLASDPSLSLALAGATGAVLTRIWLYALTRHLGISTKQITLELTFALSLIGSAAGYTRMTYKSPEVRQVVVAPVQDIPGQSAWIYAGASDARRTTFTEGPFVAVIRKERLGHQEIQVGDKVVVVQQRMMFCVDYQTLGLANRFRPPTERDAVRAADEIGITLPVGTRLIVRQISEGISRETGSSVLWLRVALDSEFPDRAAYQQRYTQPVGRVKGERLYLRSVI